MSDGLVVTDLSVAYRGAVRALDGVSLELAEGDRIAVLGPNGAGKTTLVRSLTGMLGFYGGRVLSGAATAWGTEIAGAGTGVTVRLGMTQIPEGRQVFKNLTVEENLRLGALTRHKKDIGADIDSAIAHFPALKTKRKTNAGLLSGGEQQMLAIARGLMAEPRLIILDEPSLGLMPIVTQEVFRLIEAVNKSGIGVLLVEQNLHQSLRIAHRGYVLEKGAVVLSGTGQELLADAYVQKAFLGR